MSATALSTIALMFASSVVRRATVTRPSWLGFALSPAFGDAAGFGVSAASGDSDGHGLADGFGDFDGSGDPLALFWPSRPRVSAATSFSALVRRSFSWSSAVLMSAPAAWLSTPLPRRSSRPLWSSCQAASMSLVAALRWDDGRLAAAVGTIG